MAISPTQIAKAVLIYDAADERLHGKIGAHHFNMIAYSGGGRGSVHPKLWQQSLSSHSSTTKKDAHHRGGTLPAGHYACHYLAHHLKFHECIQLLRMHDAMSIRSPFSTHPIAHHRGNDFFIHGRGEHGSDGCIVPKEPVKRHALNLAVKNFQGHVYVHVINVPYMLPTERGVSYVA